MVKKRVATARNRAVKEEVFTRWDAVDSLKSDADVAAYLEAAMQEAGDDAAYIAAVLGDIAKARRIMDLAGKAGMTRAGLYKALAPGGNPSFVTILKVTKVLGLKFVPRVAA
ncbi:addiction module antidote protein [Povalibacter sp.]|uniref:addiction module antidote protein n=1 Tax=Povalibacter sp. TaxID=1962978 RepID=UPI002F3F68E4